jgi:hypothetical protein
MEKLTISQVMEMTQIQVENRLALYKNPVVINISMIVDLEEDGRIRAFAFPDIRDMLGKELVKDDKKDERNKCIHAWLLAQSEGKDHRDLIKIDEMAGYFLSTYGKEAVSNFDKVMIKDVASACDYSYWNRVREILLSHS